MPTAFHKGPGYGGEIWVRQALCDTRSSSPASPVLLTLPAAGFDVSTEGQSPRTPRQSFRFAGHFSI